MAVARVLLQGVLKCQVEPTGAKDGANLDYALPEFFLEDSIKVYRNGIRQFKGATCDYTVSESGGLGTGFDTIEFVDRPLITGDNLFADYIAA